MSSALAICLSKTLSPDTITQKDAFFVQATIWHHISFPDDHVYDHHQDRLVTSALIFKPLSDATFSWRKGMQW